MLPLLIPLLTNVIGGLCADAATDLAKEHVMKMIKKAVPPDAMEAIDTIISSDPSHPCDTMEHFIDCMVDPDNNDVPSIPGMPDMPDIGPMTISCDITIDPATMDITVTRT